MGLHPSMASHCGGWFGKVTTATSEGALKQETAGTSLRPKAVKAWCGLRGEIAVEDELWHLVRVGGVSLPHPPLVNLMIRRGLAADDRLHFSYLHEFGHLQTLPLTGIHVLLLVWLSWRGTRPAGIKLLAGLLAHEAVWELASEGYAVLHAGRRYRRAYLSGPNRWQGLFWLGMSLLAAIGIWLVGSRRSPG